MSLGGGTSVELLTQPLHSKMTRPPKAKHVYLSAPSNIMFCWKMEAIELPPELSSCLPSWGWPLLGIGLREGMEYAWPTWSAQSTRWCPAPSRFQSAAKGGAGGKWEGRRSWSWLLRGGGSWGVIAPRGAAVWTLQTQLFSPRSVSVAHCLRPSQALRVSSPAGG